jgi:hypothetical protein
MKKGLYWLLVFPMLGSLLGSCSPPGKPAFEFVVQPSTGVFSAAGETITYSYTAKNPNVEMQIEIVDNRFGQPCGPFVLRPQGMGGPSEKTCTFTYTTTGSDVQAGAINNSAVATAHSAGDSCCGTDNSDTRNGNAQVVLEMLETVQVLSAGCDQEISQIYIAVDTGLQSLTPDQEVTYSASDGQTSYSCYTSRTGVIYCTGIPGDSPGPLEICMQKPAEPEPVCTTISDFPSWIAGISCQPDWNLNHPGCHSEEEIFFTLDTGFTWLTSNEGVTFAATDGDTTYTCSVATAPGRVYCYGPRPDNPGALEFCIQREGDSKPLCQVFTGYPQVVWDFSCIPPTPTDRPGQNAPGTCASITSPAACQANTSCTWETSTNKCVSK